MTFGGSSAAYPLGGVDYMPTIGQLMELGDRFDLVCRRETAKSGTQLKALVIKNASSGYHRGGRGRRNHIPGTGPGPNVRTGNYRRTITVQLIRPGADSPSYAAVASTNAPQALRLEYGFVGTDSIGRRYNQQPYPHWRPAIAVVEPQHVQRMTDAIDRELYRLRSRAAVRTGNAEVRGSSA